MKPEEALAIYQAGPETVVRALLEMDAQLNAGELRVRHLEGLVAKDSHNSSKPPSSDGLNKPKPKPKSLRPASERTTGGQQAHSGRTLRNALSTLTPMVANPDAVVSHPVNQCAGCGISLSEQKPDRVERRQVFDVPAPKLEVTGGARVESALHQAEVKTCACGCVNRAAFPPDVTAPVQYGLRIQSIAVYLKPKFP